MWMLDVFCCALGCVTLLWLLKTREAGFALEETSNIRSTLTDTQLLLLDESARNLDLQLNIEELIDRIARVENERDANAKQLALTREELEKSGKRLALVEMQATETAKNLALTEKKLDDQKRLMIALESKSTTSEEELSKKKTEVTTLSKQIDASKRDLEALEKLLRTREKERDAETKRVSELNREIEAMSKTRTELDTKSVDLTKALERIKQLEKQAGDSSAMIVDLQGTKAKLADKLNRLEIEAQNKFAGISLTGKKVLFMIDMSGSMEMVDEKTLEPTKWPTVRDTLVKVMRSLPDLEKIQIILFSNRVMYLLPESKDWIDYDRTKTPEMVQNAMTVLKPQGDTNMYAAFEEAFKFREKGMDTIYLLSDGLPNSGPGLTEAQQRATMSDSEKQTLLGRHIRTLLTSQWNRVTASQPSKVRINSIGFFFESPDLGAFLWALARENDGSFVGMSKP
jgi:myosin heavy subunit